MWVTHLIDRFKAVLATQAIYIIIEGVEGKSTCLYTCQVGREKNELNQWKWVLPYEYPCECAKIIYGGTNIDRPERPFKPVYVDEPMVGDNTGKMRDHYGLNCLELSCPSSKSKKAYHGQATRRVTWKIKEAFGNYGESLSVTCDPPTGTDFSIGQTNVSCETCDQRGNHKNCTFSVKIKDFDECKNGSHNCAANALCINTNGSYNCTCRDGYEGDGFKCEDVNECTVGDHNCDTDSTCNNTEGSFSCNCKDGYSGDGSQCEDINECTDVSHTCDPNAYCENTNGGFNCICNEGFIGDGMICEDACTDPSKLGMEDGRIPDNKITASSTWSGTVDTSTKNARLNRPGGWPSYTGSWCAGVNDQNPWIMAGLSEPMLIAGVITQGRSLDNDDPNAQWVTKYKVQYSEIDANFKYVRDLTNTTDMEFIGNSDRETPVENIFPLSVRANYVKIRPTARFNYISMRFEVLGCPSNVI